MPKSLTIDPSDVRKRSVIKSQEIPVNAYVEDAKREAAQYGSDNLVHMYRDMLYIREFEGDAGWD